MTLQNINAKKHEKEFIFNLINKSYSDGLSKQGFEIKRTNPVGQEVYHVQIIDLFGCVRFTIKQDWKKDFIRFGLNAPRGYDVDRITNLLLNILNK